MDQPTTPSPGFELLEVCVLLREGSNSSVFVALDQAPIDRRVGRVPSTLFTTPASPLVRNPSRVRNFGKHSPGPYTVPLYSVVSTTPPLRFPLITLNGYYLISWSPAPSTCTGDSFSKRTFANSGSQPGYSTIPLLQHTMIRPLRCCSCPRGSSHPIKHRILPCSIQAPTHCFPRRGPPYLVFARQEDPKPSLILLWPRAKSGHTQWVGSRVHGKCNSLFISFPPSRPLPSRWVLRAPVCVCFLLKNETWYPPADSGWYFASPYCQSLLHLTLKRWAHFCGIPHEALYRCNPSPRGTRSLAAFGFTLRMFTISFAPIVAAPRLVGHIG